MRPFDMGDQKQISGWYLKRGMKMPGEDYIPSVGFIEDGVAAGFMIQTDVCMAIFDLYITNPDAPKAKRQKALSDITAALIQKAASLDYRVIKADSQINTIKDLAKQHGFRSLGEYALFAKEL